MKPFARMASPGDLIGAGDGWSLVCSVEALAANSILGLAGAVKGEKRAVGSVHTATLHIVPCMERAGTAVVRTSHTY